MKIGKAELPKSELTQFFAGVAFGYVIDKVVQHVYSGATKPTDYQETPVFHLDDWILLAASFVIMLMTGYKAFGAGMFVGILVSSARIV